MIYSMMLLEKKKFGLLRLNKSYLFLPLLLLTLLTKAQPTDVEIIDDIIAVVGNEIILRSEIETQKLELTRRGMNVDAQAEGVILEEMMLQKLMVHMARVDSIEVTDAEIQAEMDQRLSHFITQFGSEEAFEEFYGKSIPEFRQEFEDPLREQLMVEKYRPSITKGAKVTPEDIVKYFESIPKDSLPLIESEVQFSHIVINPTVRQKAKDKVVHLLDSIRQDLMDGKTTMLVQAARHSEDPGSKFKGGCYELIRRGSFDPAYEAAVFNTKEGNYSQVFESQFGYHIVQVKEKRGELFTSCHILKRPEILPSDLDRARVKLDSIVTAIKTDTLLFSKAAELYSNDKESSNQGGKVVDPRSKVSRFEINSLDPTLFFVIDELEPGEMSDLLEYEKEDGTKAWRVIRLDTRSTPHKANLRDDYQLIQMMAEQDAEEVVMEAWIKDNVTQTYIKVKPELNTSAFRYDWLNDNP
jgi:peptidyl-prolyl cis-trans isomerase SurA